MKPSRLHSALRFSLFLMLITSFTTAVAYDFESNGIYYNITSSNTVEVTYRDISENDYNVSYSSDTEIPSTVTHNNMTYTVTAIGDSAFYVTDVYHGYKHSERSTDLVSGNQSSSYGFKVTIPETVILIGSAAFSNIFIYEVTCKAAIPPTLLENCFYCHSYNGGGYSTSDYADPSNNEWYYYEPGTFYPIKRDKRPWTLLYVPTDSYDSYKNNSKWNSYFNFIAPIGAPKTANPYFNLSNSAYEYEVIASENADQCAIYTMTLCGRYLGYYNVTSWHFGSSGPISWGCYEPEEDHSYVEFHVYAYACEEGKAPSDIVDDYIFMTPNDFMGSEEWEYDVKFYDFCDDGICYRITNDNTVAVAPDIIIYILWANLYYRCYSVEQTILESNYGRLGLYNRDVVIPKTVDYNGKTYNVTTIADCTMGTYQEDYEYNTLSGRYPFTIWIEGCHPTSLTIPTSITSIWDNSFPDYTYGDCYNFDAILKISGEGEWSGYNMNFNLPRLDIANGITAISGLMVNPREVYCYAKVPPTCDENSFTDYTGTLHVPESSLAAYFTAPYWCNFANIVGDAVELQDISINKDGAELVIGEQINLNATLLPSNANAEVIQWHSSDPTIATVNNDGVVSAKSEGECDIIASCLDKRATCHVTVIDVKPTSITLNQENALMELGETLTLTYTVEPENAVIQSITWWSSNSSVANVNYEGKVTANGVGECNIYARCRGLTDTCHIKVVEQIVTISFDQHHASLLPNHILTLTPTVSPAPTPLVVTSSNPSVAAARLTNGVVQVVGISPGTSVIKVASADDNAFADSCLVNVYTEVGDVDGDGFVKIDDVTTIIDYLLGGSASNFNAANADVDFDGDIDISDVTELIDHLLSGGTWQNERFMVNGVPFTMVRVAAGSFMMGATEEQGDDASTWEKPVHQVTLSSYMIGQTEVTQELWLAVMGTNPSLHSGSLQKPVENVSWDDCQAFITQLNALTGQHFRMPTEAEWEYAARGGNKSLGYKYAGSNNIDEVGWVTGTTTHPVGELQPNELGLYDMSGNVDEWVWDYFGYYTSEHQTDPTGPETGDNRMYRGGSWYGGANASRVSYRFFRAPTFKRGTMGLRLVL